MKRAAGFSINGIQISITPSTSLSSFDIGTAIIGGPSADVRQIWAAVPSAVALNGTNAGFWTLREFEGTMTHPRHLMRRSLACSTQLGATITFGGKAWPISEDDLKIRSSVPGTCIGGVFDYDTVNGIPTVIGSHRWHVGAAFLVCFPLAIPTNPSDHAVDRKTCTLYIAPHLRLWALHGYQVLRVDQVRRFSIMIWQLYMHLTTPIDLPTTTTMSATVADKRPATSQGTCCHSRLVALYHFFSHYSTDNDAKKPHPEH